MTFLDLITYLAAQQPVEPLYRAHGVTPDTPGLAVYLGAALRVDADIALLGVEATDGDLQYVQHGVQWLYCLELDLVEEMVADGVAERASPVAIAARVLDYACYDA